MLTTEDREKILVDEVNGSKPRVTGKEADAFKKSLKKDIDLAKKNGWQIEIPTEWQVDTKGEIKSKS